LAAVAADFCVVSDFWIVRAPFVPLPHAHGSLPAAIATLREPPTTDYRPPTARETTSRQE
jgi:hypothetical protein